MLGRHSEVEETVEKLPGMVGRPSEMVGRVTDIAGRPAEAVGRPPETMGRTAERSPKIESLSETIGVPLDAVLEVLSGVI